MTEWQIVILIMNFMVAAYNWYQVKRLFTRESILINYISVLMNYIGLDPNEAEEKVKYIMRSKK